MLESAVFLCQFLDGENGVIRMYVPPHAKYRILTLQNRNISAGKTFKTSVVSW